MPDLTAPLSSRFSEALGADEDQAIAALLHDSIEDAPPSLGAEWVRRWLDFRFGKRVLAIIEGCTDADVRPKPDWIPRKVRYVAEVPSKSADVVLVSAADKLHNATAILADLREVELEDELWSRFNPRAGKSGVIGMVRIDEQDLVRPASAGCARREYTAPVTGHAIIRYFKGQGVVL